MNQPNHPQDFDAEPDNDPNAIAFITFSLITCLLMLLAALLLGIAL